MKNKKNKDWVNANWERRRDLAITLGKSLVGSLMKNYHEPSRAGTPKGNPIGFSRKKKRAALLMILYNPSSGLGLNEIGKIAHVSPPVLQVWRTQKSFMREIMDACDSVKELIVNTIHNELAEHSSEGLKEPSLELTGVERGRARYFLLKHLSFFNPVITYPVIGFIIKNMELSIPGYVELGRWWKMLSSSDDVKDEKSYQRWKSRPEIKNFTKAIISRLIDLISDPENMKELGPERINEQANFLKKVIFKELDLKAS